MTQPRTRIVEGFSLSHAAILDGTTGQEEDWGDLYGVRSGSIAVQSQNYDNTGDDFVLSSWFWFDYGEVTVQMGYVPMDTIANLSGNPISSDTSGGAGSEVYAMDVWTSTDLNQPARPMQLVVPSKDDNGAIAELLLILFKVQFMPFTFDGPSYKSGLLVNYGGRALVSLKDHKGNALTKRTIGRVISQPVAA